MSDNPYLSSSDSQVQITSLRHLLQRVLDESTRNNMTEPNGSAILPAAVSPDLFREIAEAIAYPPPLASVDNIDNELKRVVEDVEQARREEEAMKDTARVTLSGRPPETLEGGAPAPLDLTTGMFKDYWVLPEADRAKGFIRPVRDTYRHTSCTHTTTMNQAIAETYARNPTFYGRTFCSHCGSHFPVGAEGEFTWLDGSKVGT